MADNTSPDTIDTRPWYFNVYTGSRGRFVKCLGTCPHDDFVAGMTALLGITTAPGHIIALDREPEHPLGPAAR